MLFFLFKSKSPIKNFLDLGLLFYSVNFFMCGSCSFRTGEWYFTFMKESTLLYFMDNYFLSECWIYWYGTLLIKPSSCRSCLISFFSLWCIPDMKMAASFFWKRASNSFPLYLTNYTIRFFIFLPNLMPNFLILLTFLRDWATFHSF